ncbi:O-antigen ligase family protein [Patescibacteria group bacterium]|nr:O-antigen ligase family protein [Patescibacteria group bacterium]
MCFYAFFLFLPFQVKTLLFSPEYFGSGFFSPYLSQFLYLGDLFLLIGFLFMGFAFVLGKKVEAMVRFRDPVFLLLLGLFFVTVFLPWNGLLYLLRFVEWGALLLLLNSGFLKIVRIFEVLLFGICVSAVIGIFQFVLGGSLGFGFLGEPLISGSMLGVSKVSLFGDSVLRAYGTFPHPNVLAVYCVFGIFLALYLWKGARLIYTAVLVLLSVALLLTFSRSALIGGVSAGVFVYALGGVKIKFKYLLLALVSVLFFIVVFDLQDFFVGRLLLMDSENVLERELFHKIAFAMIFDNWNGVGLGNFTAQMQNYTDIELLPWNFQPVHNLYLLIFAEGGVLMGLSFCALLLWSFWDIVKNKNSKSFKALLLAFWALIFVVGFFDHYLLTLYQGQALLWTFFGLRSKI